jgi:hypothetical protein
LHPPNEEFLKRASDCETMAKVTRDPESKTTWNRMAERWRRCADKFVSESQAAKNHPPTRYRKAEPSWAHPSLKV